MDTVLHEQAAKSKQPDYPKIGRVLKANALYFPGKDYFGGYGNDLPPDVAQAWLTAISIQPNRPMMSRLADRLSQLLVKDGPQQEWWSKATRWYGNSVMIPDQVGIPLIDPHLHHLRFAWAFPGPTLDHIAFHQQQPKLVQIQPLTAQPRWRHYQFARGLFGDRTPHLRTREMDDPDWVWRRLIALFENYCGLVNRCTFDTLTLEQQLREFIALYLALYEQCLYLYYEVRRQRPRFLTAISQRQPAGDIANDQILMISDEPLKASDLDFAQQYRTNSYTTMLVNFLSQRIPGEVEHATRRLAELSLSAQLAKAAKL